MQMWFQEEIDPNQRFSYKVKDILFRGKSDFQTVDVIETEAYGRMLLIDGLVMITDRDEFVYHEMIAHIPALNHKKPERVVVIGGGDGGTVRELLKHPSVKEVVLCEIDGLVVDASKKYFPEVAGCLDDARVKVNIGDGLAYMKNHAPGVLDLVIVDSTDPVGPGEGLFTKEFYSSVSKALKPDGMMACQSESPWYPKEILQRIYNNVSGGFNFIKPYVGSVPTYPTGTWSWTLASNQELLPANYDKGRFKSIDEKGLSYLSEGMMEGAFAIPNFHAKKLGIK